LDRDRRRRSPSWCCLISVQETVTEIRGICLPPTRLHGALRVSPSIAATMCRSNETRAFSSIFLSNTRRILSIKRGPLSFAHRSTMRRCDMRTSTRTSSRASGASRIATLPSAVTRRLKSRHSSMAVVSRDERPERDQRNEAPLDCKSKKRRAGH